MTGAGPRRLEITFCSVCKFGGRAFWLARELYDQRPELIAAISLLPTQGGVFRVRYGDDVVWDYPAVQDGFPEPKQIREAMLAAAGLPPAPKKHDGRDAQ